MKELTFHQAADAVRAGKDILLATRFTKSLVNTAFFDAERYFIDESNEQLKNSSQELKKSTQEPKKTGPAAVKLAYDGTRGRPTTKSVHTLAVPGRRSGTFSHAKARRNHRKGNKQWHLLRTSRRSATCYSRR